MGLSEGDTRVRTLRLVMQWILLVFQLVPCPVVVGVFAKTKSRRTVRLQPMYRYLHHLLHHPERDPSHSPWASHYVYSVGRLCSDPLTVY